MKDLVKKKAFYVYRGLDLVLAVVAWIIYTFLRQKSDIGYWDADRLDWGTMLWSSLVVFIFWMLFYHFLERGKDIYRLSRFNILFQTLILSFTGTLILFLIFGREEFILDYDKHYRLFFAYFWWHFLLTAVVRMILLTRSSRALKSGQVSYRTLIIGGERKATEMYSDISGRTKKLGHEFIGFIDINGSKKKPLAEHLEKLGAQKDIEHVIENENVEEVIIALEKEDHHNIEGIMNVLSDLDPYILIKVIPDMYDIMLGSVKMSHIYGAILIEVERKLIEPWQAAVKRMFDVVMSIFLLILLSPVLIYVALRVRLSSEGPILYKQERIGRYGKPFMILKFRSMYVDAERQGPQLSSDSDDRITPWGRVIRKWRLDELPQFVNVLKGDMSIVGPRPERQYYIDQITERAPHYKHLLKVRPGITSWGQVKYGYASNVDQMIQRLQYDILYIENMSLALDVKIIFYTVLVLLQGRGK